MSDNSAIEWTDATWNPVTGCTKVSPGCDHCYAETLAERFRGTAGHYYEHGFDVQLRPDKLDLPLRWTKPRRVFVNSMSDLFHEQVPDEYIARVFVRMSMARQHTFQILTKRHARMRSLLNSESFKDEVAIEMINMAAARGIAWPPPHGLVWPRPNVWLGVSVEDQKWADIRIPFLVDTPAAVRFLSCEPLLGSVDLSGYLGEALASQSTAETAVAYGVRSREYSERLRRYFEDRSRPSIDWVIVGGESGRGARPMHPDWARRLRDQCETAKVPFLFKQRGEWTWNEPGRFRMPTKPYTDRVAVMHGAGMTAMTKRNPFDPFAVSHPHWATRIDRVGKHAAGRELDGRTWDQYPATVPA